MPNLPAPVLRCCLILALGTPLLSGHLGLLHELAAAGRDVRADYAVNCFNQHTAAECFALGAAAAFTGWGESFITDLTSR